jgi:hypothetical protein
MHELSEALRSSIGKLLLDSFAGYESTLSIHDSSVTPVIEVITALDRARCFAEAKRAYEAALAQAQTPEAKRPWAERGLRFYERCIPEADKHGLAAESEDMAGRVKLALRILGIDSSAGIPEYASFAALTLPELETMPCTAQTEGGGGDKGPLRDTATNSSDRESGDAGALQGASATVPNKRLEHIEFTLNGLNFRVRRNLSRINVEHEQSGRQGFIRLDQHLCGGDEFRWAQTVQDRRFVSDRCGITVEYGIAKDSPVAISLHGTGITLMIDCPDVLKNDKT